MSEEPERKAQSKEDQAKAEAGAAAIAASMNKDAFVGDVDGAKKYKEDTDTKIAALQAEADALTGKDNKKAKKEKEKEAYALKNSDEYIDAQRVIKGLAPNKGHFAGSPAKAAGGYAGDAKAAPEAPPETVAEADAKKDTKKKEKKTESAGISPDERKELEKIKTDIIEKKKALKESGMSGGQINKEPEIVQMVARLNELKEKESPGSSLSLADKKKAEKKKSKGSLSDAERKELDELKVEIETYKIKLVKECGYTKKDMNGDPDLQDMQKKLKDLESRA